MTTGSVSANPTDSPECVATERASRIAADRHRARHVGPDAEQGKVERFNSYLKGSFVVPLAATLEASGLCSCPLRWPTHVRRWLDEIANARVHGTTQAVPAVRLADERAVMLPAPTAQRVALPVESLQHPLAVYDALLCPELLEVFA